jgi:hypothetical protein
MGRQAGGSDRMSKALRDRPPEAMARRGGAPSAPNNAPNNAADNAPDSAPDSAPDTAAAGATLR